MHKKLDQCVAENLVETNCCRMPCVAAVGRIFNIISIKSGADASFSKRNLKINYYGKVSNNLVQSKPKKLNELVGRHINKQNLGDKISLAPGRASAVLPNLPSSTGGRFRNWCWSWHRCWKEGKIVEDKCCTQQFAAF